MPQTTLQAPSGKVCKIMVLVIGPRGGMKWFKFVEKTASETGMIELNLDPGHYRLVYKKDAMSKSIEFQVK
ncbi:hypothetical protein ccbrp13_56060 [Ktedonobacteria bacterium brp13]|nr:hypothetical protein ccbrp13_56060 [Ktedonobacteria bacterium brp13]